MVDLFNRSDAGLNILSAQLPGNAHIAALGDRQKDLADRFNRSNQRMVDGKTLFDESERPAARQDFSTLSAEQMKLAVGDVEQLIEQGRLALSRATFIALSIRPLFAGTVDEAGWTDNISTHLKSALKATDDAETMLRNHAARHSFFDRRVEMARTGQPSTTPQP